MLICDVCRRHSREAIALERDYPDGKKLDLCNYHHQELANVLKYAMGVYLADHSSNAAVKLSPQDVYNRLIPTLPE